MARVRLDELWLEDSDDKLYRRVSGGFREVSPSAAGGEGAVNYAKNPLEEDSLLQLAYSGVTPVWSTTHNLFGGGALRCNMTSSGTGRYLRIALDDLSDAQITEMLRLSFFYKLVTGGDDAVRLSIWDGTNHTYLTPEYLVSASGSITKYDGWCFSISKTSHYLQFTFKDSTAIDFYVAAVSFAPRVLPQGAVISEWKSYTPQIKGMTTDPTPGAGYTLTGKYRRVGADLEFAMYFSQPVAGTNGSGIYYITLPSEFIPDWSSYPSYGLINIGTARVYYTGGSNAGLGQVVLSAGDQKIYCIFITATTSNYTPWSSTTYALGGSAGLMTLDVLGTIRISGWTSSINLVTETQEFAFNTQATINTNDTTSFGYGPGGTPILANTAITYYDVQFKSDIQPSDNIILEVRSKSGAWIDSARCSGASFCGLAPGWNASSDYGVGINQVGSKVVRVRFNSFASIQAGTARTWATMIAYSDGFDRWRVRKISNGNMAEAPASGIYESGQNANGYYVKYVDGTMVQWGVTPSMTNSTTGNRTETFPAVFANIPVVTITPGAGVARWSSSEANDVVYSITSSTFVIASGRGVSTPFQWLAIGKWNLSRSVAAPGTPVGASTVLAHYRQSSAYAVGSLQPYDYDELIEDSLGCVTIGSSWKFTAPVSGLYLVTATIPIGASTYSALYKNGALAQQFGVFGSNTAMNACPVSAVIRLAQGDYIDMRSTYTGSISSPDRFIQITRLSA